MCIQSKIYKISSQLFFPFKDVPYLPRWIVLLMDIFIVAFSFTISYLVYHQIQESVIRTDEFTYRLILNLIISTLFFLLFRTYVGIIRYSTFMDAMRIFMSLMCSTIVLFSINYIMKAYYNNPIFGGSGFLIYFALTFSLMFILRMFVKLIYDYTKKNENFEYKNKPLFIVGVQAASVALAGMIKENNYIPYRLEGFISLDSQKVSDKTILGVPVYGKKKEYERILKKGKVKSILINPKELDRVVKQELSDFCIKNNIQMLAAPTIERWDESAKKIKGIKNIQIEDLLGRIPIEINTEFISKDLEGKCIMITGAAGSIGSEIARQIAQFNPRLLLLCDIAESPLHQLHLELNENFPTLNYLPLICDVRDKNRMEKIFKNYQPQHVYHAAAYKHVPLMEEHPSESVLTNVLGTKNIADLSAHHNTEVFVMVSTDKAVNPTNVMGASKRIAEIYVHSLQDKLKSKNNLRFITTRFGNVLGSNGSVIPRFKEQIAKGGPITVTHPEIIRYFMTIPEACRLVLEAGNMGKGGEIFVFDMGEPVKIVDLATKMIQLSGLTPFQDIDIVFTGLRPGEKLYEELLANEEFVKPTYNKKIMVANVRKYNYDNVSKDISLLFKHAIENDKISVVKTMKNIVPEFISCNSIYDNIVNEFEKEEQKEVTFYDEL